MLSKEQVRKNREVIRSKLAGSLATESQWSSRASNSDSMSPHTKGRRRHMSLDLGQFDFLQQCQEMSIKTSFDQDFQLLQKIGEGTQARVYKCREKTTDKFFAVKIIKSSQLQTQIRIKDQFILIQNLKHSNIIQTLFYYFDEFEGKSMIVSQLYNYHTLQSEIRKRKGLTFPESQISFIVSELLKALKYLHDKGICHRDIKPDNILYSSIEKKVVLLDLELAKQVKKDDDQFAQMWTNTGHVFYKAPQMYDGGYNQQIDIWAVGVVCYQLAYKTLPFFSEYQKDLVDLIKHMQPKFEQKAEISQNCQEFIKKCLQKQPVKRYTVFQALNSTFMPCNDSQKTDSPFSFQQQSIGRRIRNLSIIRPHKVSISTGCSKSIQKMQDSDQQQSQQESEF